MLKIRAAEFNIALDMFDSEFFEKRFAEYKYDFDTKPDFYCISRSVKEIIVPDEKIISAEKGRKFFSTDDKTVTVSYSKNDTPIFSASLSKDASFMEINMLEKATYRFLTKTSTEYSYSCSGFSAKAALSGDLVLHGAAIAYKGKGIIFSARPGVGKSTQAGLWETLWPKDVMRVNEDRPIIKFENNTSFMHGMPWSGSVPINLNVKVPLAAIFMLQRSEKPSIQRLRPADVFRHIFTELCTSQLNNAAKEAVYDSLDTLLRCTPVYLLNSNMEDETPILAKETLEKEGLL